MQQFALRLKKYSCILLLLVVCRVNAQNTGQKFPVELKNVRSDTARIRILVKLAEKFQNNKPSVAEKYAQEAVSIAENIKDTSGIISGRLALGNVYMFNTEYQKQLYNYLIAYKLCIQKNNLEFLTRVTGNLGVVYNNLAKLDSSIYFSKQSIEISRKIKDELGEANGYASLGSTYIEMSEFSKALEQFHNALRLNEKNNRFEQISDCVMNCGAIFYELSEYDKALNYFERALAIKEKISHKPGIAKALSNIANIMIAKGKYDKALEYYNRSLVLKREIEDVSGEAMTTMNIGVLYATQENYEKALPYFEKSLMLFEKSGNKYNIAQCYNNLGAIYNMLNKNDKAIVYAEKAIGLAENIGAKYIRLEALQLLYEIYKSKKKYKESLEFHEMFLILKDSILDEEKGKEITRREMQFAFDKKTSADSIRNTQEKVIKDAQIAAQKNKLQQEKTLRYALFVGLALVIVFTMFLINRFNLIKRQKNVIEEQKQMVELQRQKVMSVNEELQQNNEEILAQRDEIENQKHLVEEKQKEIIDSITYAKRLQQAILPSIAEVQSYLPDSFIHYQPKDIVAGDFYWMHSTENSQLFLAAADCTGHGVPGAMVSVVCSNALNRAVKEFKLTDPGLILDKTRELVLETFEKSGEEIKDGMDISLVSIDYKEQKNNTQEISIKWSGANNPLWILKNADKELPQRIIEPSYDLVEIKPNKQPIGKYEESVPFKTHVLQLEKGNIIYLFTDGYADQFGGIDGKKFKYRQLKDLIMNICEKPMNVQQKILSDIFENWKGSNEQVDDVCMLGVRL